MFVGAAREPPYGSRFYGIRFNDIVQPAIMLPHK
jgi:hypothetical protein